MPEGVSTMITLNGMQLDFVNPSCKTSLVLVMANTPSDPAYMGLWLVVPDEPRPDGRPPFRPIYVRLSPAECAIGVECLSATTDRAVQLFRNQLQTVFESKRGIAQQPRISTHAHKGEYVLRYPFTGAEQVKFFCNAITTWHQPPLIDKESAP